VIAKEKLDFWLANNYNVLFAGKHGVGKTTVVLEAFDRMGLRWLYYSASTMDPWVDMIGVPKEKTNPETGVSTLELIRPKEFQNDEVEAIFFDEFNRSHKKIRNAVMELIQFKSINGKKFKNLKVIWAAINPDDEEDTYDVERLDPAQEDRFHIKVAVPYKPSAEYFSGKYGRDTARAAISWWNGLPTEQQDKVSPRRLDYAMDIFVRGGDLRDVLPHDSNISKLITTLDNGPVEDALRKFVKEMDVEGARAWLQNENNYAAASEFLPKQKFMSFFLPLLQKEKLSALVSKHKKVREYVIAQYPNEKLFEDVLRGILGAEQNTTIVREIKKAMPQSSPLVLGAIVGLGESPTKAKHCGLEENAAYDKILETELAGLQRSNTYQRLQALNTISNTVPEKLTPAQMTMTLKVLDRIAASSHNNTLNGVSGQFFGVLNHVLEQLFKKGMLFSQMQADPKTYPLGNILKRARRDRKLAGKILYKNDKI